MANLLEIPQRLLWALFSNAKDTPLPLLLLILATIAVSTLAFVRTPNVLQSPTAYQLKRAI
jgi:hypothetical protein